MSVSGKGWDADAAQASCVYEALERSSVVHRGDETLVSARYEDLGSSAVCPAELLQYSARQYANRDIWNVAFGECQYIPHPWNPADLLEWMPCTDVLTQETVLVPAGACFLRYAPPQLPVYFPNETTGCAAAENFDEAIVRGFLEIIERDAVALWWYNRWQAPAVDISSFHLPQVDRLTEYLTSRGRTLYALDITADSEIPVIAAVSATRTGDAVMFGFSADFSAATALERAVLEVLQILGPVHTWSREGMLKFYDLPPDRKAWVEYATIANQPYLNPSHHEVRVAGSFRHEVPAASERLGACVRVARQMQLRLLVADMTRDDVGVPVARVIVPGCRSSWARFGPGRLFSTPVALGWRDEPSSEEDLNSFPFFL